MSSALLLNKLKGSSRLPSPSGLAIRILQLCQRSDVSIKDLADTLEADPALSLRILKYANSALVGATNEVTSVRDAVVLLGLRSVRLVSLSFSVVSTDDPRGCRGFDYDRFWAHSVACAVAARHLAGQGPSPAPEEAFATGLLAHIGKMVFAIGMPEDYPAVLQAAGGTLGRTEKYEAGCLGASHHDLGADLLVDWGIPERMAQAVRCQRVPEGDIDDPGVRRLAAIVHAATDLADILCQAAPDNTLAARRQALGSSTFFHNEDEVDRAVTALRKEFKELACILSVSEGMERTPGELQAEAGAILSELSLAAQLQSDAIAEENRGLQEKALTDGLTGIANRTAFDERSARIWKEVTQKNCPIALVMIDIDHFKKFNDNFGNQTGDAVLQGVAGCLPGAVRRGDFVARYGGDEFVAILPNADQMTAAGICVKIRKAIEALVVSIDGRQHHVTVSVGAALLPRPGKPYTPEMLIEAADQQLYVSKDKGRNCCSMKQLQPGTAEPVTA